MPNDQVLKDRLERAHPFTMAKHSESDGSGLRGSAATRRSTITWSRQACAFDTFCSHL
jgi:hypothetical protein